MTSAIEAQPCKTCGAPAAFQFVGGSFCRKHWDAAFYGSDGERNHHEEEKERLLSVDASKFRVMQMPVELGEGWRVDACYMDGDWKRQIHQGSSEAPTKEAVTKAMQTLWDHAVERGIDRLLFAPPLLPGCRLWNLNG